MPARNPGESESSGGGEPRPYEKNISRYAQLFTTLCIEKVFQVLPGIFAGYPERMDYII